MREIEVAQDLLHPAYPGDECREDTDAGLIFHLSGKVQTHLFGLKANGNVQIAIETLAAAVGLSLLGNTGSDRA